MKFSDIVNVVIVEINLIATLGAGHCDVIELVLDERILCLVNAVVNNVVGEILKGLCSRLTVIEEKSHILVENFSEFLNNVVWLAVTLNLILLKIGDTNLLGRDVAVNPLKGTLVNFKREVFRLHLSREG